eukprot:COSAG04_NODE_1125_length_8150_cov_9.257484_7_plen_229_part_00
MYGYGNVSNHLSFVPSSGKSASKGFDTCERNHSPDQREQRDPGSSAIAPGCAASRELEGDPGSSAIRAGCSLTSQRAWTSFSSPTSASLLAKDMASSKGAGAGSRSRSGEPERRAGAQSRSHCAETRRVLPLCWAGQRHAAVTVLSVCSRLSRGRRRAPAELDELGMPRLRDRRSARGDFAEGRSDWRVGELFESHKWLLCKESSLGATEGRYPVGVTAGESGNRITP